MIVATAGHIDHGKTALVRALTGADTDRLPEEKARGISIDLGFAYWPLGDGRTIGFVDVPGHERFVRNMLAGVAAIDCVLLVVAADDGVMPQTIEHVRIVDLLGVSRGVVVVNKIDRVPPERVAAVAADVARLLARSPLAAMPVLPVSALDGRGLDALRAALVDACDATSRAEDAGRGFRFVVDRSFTIAGSGTVVTGTAVDGRVRIGDRLVASRGGEGVRVRGLQQAGRPVDVARAGERVAINVAGIDLDRIGRGDWLVERHAPSSRLEVRLRLPDGADDAKASSIGHGTRVRLHIGAADVPARISLPGGRAVDDASPMVQLVVDRPIVAANGDRFVVRDASAAATIGGGIVIDSHAPRRRGDLALRDALLRAFETHDPARALAVLADEAPHGIDLDHFEQVFDLRRERMDALVRERRLDVFGAPRRVALSATVVDRVRRDALDAVTAFHRESPQSPGIELAELARRRRGALPQAVFVDVLRRIAATAALRIAGSKVHRADHVATGNRHDEMHWQRIRPWLEQAGFRGATVAALAQDARIAEPTLRDLLHRKLPTHDVVRVTAERFYLASTMTQLAALARRTATGRPDGAFSAAQFRDAAGVNRTLAIEILECLDRLHVTQRIGDVRKMQRDPANAIGATPDIAGATQAPQAPPTSRTPTADPVAREATARRGAAAASANR